MSTDYSDNDRFQFWLMDMDDAIQRFIVSAPDSIKSRLDFTDESLNALEEWVLQEYKGPADTRPQEGSTFLDGAAAILERFSDVAQGANGTFGMTTRSMCFADCPY